jgi:chitodextrinase
MSKQNVQQRRNSRRERRKTPPQQRPNWHKLIAIIGIVMFLSLSGGILAQWRDASVGMKAPLAPIPPPLPSPSPLSLSKEYIYAGGKLVATDEPGVVTPLSAPGSFVAKTYSNTRLDLTWTASTGPVDHYQIERTNRGTVVLIEAPSNSLNDSSVTPGTAYLYKVRAVDALGNFSPYSNVDLATAVTFLDDPFPVSPVKIKAQHLTELRDAINAVRWTAGLGLATWTNSSPQGVRIQAAHVQELRTALDQALTALGLPIETYSDSGLPGHPLIRKDHIEQLRQRVK